MAGLGGWLFLAGAPHRSGLAPEPDVRDESRPHRVPRDLTVLEPSDSLGRTAALPGPEAGELRDEPVVASRIPVADPAQSELAPWSLEGSPDGVVVDGVRLSEVLSGATAEWGRIDGVTYFLATTAESPWGHIGSSWDSSLFVDPAVAAWEAVEDESENRDAPDDEPWAFGFR